MKDRESDGLTGFEIEDGGAMPRFKPGQRSGPVENVKTAVKVFVVIAVIYLLVKDHSYGSRIVELEDHFTCLKPHMKPDERALFAEHAYNASIYLEWGSGGSSATFAQTAQQVYSIENYWVWCDFVKNDPCVQNNIDKFHQKCVTDPEVQILDWGIPSPKTKWKQFGKEYVIDAPVELGLKPGTIDFILVDGRYRAACGLNAMQYLKPGTGVLGIHDYNKERQTGPNHRYNIVEKYFDKIVQHTDAAVFMPKKDYDKEALEKDLDYWLGQPDGPPDHIKRRSLYEMAQYEKRQL